MSSRYPDLPICEHITAGQQLQEARALIFDVLSKTQRAYPKASKVARAAHQALDVLDRLRCELDNVSAQENPRDDAWAPTIYYGSNREAWERDVPPILARHQAGNPECCTTDEERGEALRQEYGIDGTMGDAQDVDHPFHRSTQGWCVVCGLSPQYRRHAPAADEVTA